MKVFGYRVRPPGRMGRGVLTLGALLTGLLAAPARATVYENNRSYFFGMGDVRCTGGLVDVPTGAVRVKFPMLKLPVRLGPEVAWFYNSQDNGDGPLGKGTSLSLSWQSYRDASSHWWIIAPGHRRYAFDYFYDWQTNSYYWRDTRDPEMLGVKFIQGANEYNLAGKLYLKDGTQFWFGYYGDLYRIQDRYGNFVEIDGSSTFPTAVHKGGTYYPRIDFTYTNGKLTRITDSAIARSWNLAYDGSGRLSTVTNPMAGVTAYTWTTYTRSDGQVLPLISTVTNPRGFTSLTAQYDTSGRATQLTAADGGVTQIAYSAGLGVDGTTTLTDPRGNTASWAFTWPAPPSGMTAKYGYRLTSLTDPLARTTTYAAGHAGSNLITSITDFRNRVTTQNWDFDKGNLLSRTTPTASGGTVTANWTYETGFNECITATDPLGHSSTTTVDPATGNMTQTRDRRGNTTNYSYNSSGDNVSITYPPTVPYTTPYMSEYRFMQYSYEGAVTGISDNSGLRASYTYDTAMRRLTATDANGKTSSYTYDLLDRVTSVSRVVGGVTLTTRYEYDSNGNRTALVDAKNQRWEWSFDSMDRCIQDKTPLLETRTYSYDQNSNLLSRTDRRGQRWEYAYGTGDRPTSQTFKRTDSTIEATVSYSYDPLTKLLASVTDSQYGTSSWGYDSLDRIISEAGPNGTLTCSWDDEGRRTGLQVPGQAAIAYGFDNNDNLVSIAQGGQTTSFTRDALNRAVVRTLPNGVATEWVLDYNGYLTGLDSKRNGTIFDIHNYTRDRESNITQETVNGTTNSFGYDEASRLVSSTVGGVSSSWTYDQVGNRLTQVAGGVSTSYTYNAADRLTGVNGVTVTSDANGNVTAYGSDTYSWDVRGRLVGLNRPGLAVTFGYQQDGLRTRKTSNGTVTTYLLNGDSVVKETTSGVATDLLQGPGTDEPLARGGKWFVPNHQGSAVALTDASGNVTQSYGYKPFGELTNSPTDSNPFQFTGRENDGTGLMYYRARYYVPQWGRFLSEDPVGVDVTGDPFVYCGNNPVNRTDPSGELPPDDGLRAVRLLILIARAASALNNTLDEVSPTGVEIPANGPLTISQGQPPSPPTRPLVKGPSPVPPPTVPEPEPPTFPRPPRTIGRPRQGFRPGTRLRSGGWGSGIAGGLRIMFIGTIIDVGLIELQAGTQAVDGYVDKVNSYSSWSDPENVP